MAGLQLSYADEDCEYDGVEGSGRGRPGSVRGLEAWEGPFQEEGVRLCGYGGRNSHRASRRRREKHQQCRLQTDHAMGWFCPAEQSRPRWQKPWHFSQCGDLTVPARKGWGGTINKSISQLSVSSWMKQGGTGCPIDERWQRRPNR